MLTYDHNDAYYWAARLVKESYNPMMCMLTGCMDPKDTWNLQKENLLTIAVFSKT
jgi:hypothetical protein